MTQNESQPIVDIADGRLMGRVKDDVLLFSGIPYAAPPTGDARFKKASPVEPWSGILDATRFGPAAPQIPSGGMTDRVPVRWDEDCLTLNVLTPGLGGNPRPVLVWIHGGAYRSGQGAIPWYNGKSFALQGDIVVVTINYRLGALGFTDLSSFHSDLATSGVNGLLDQITALTWVKQHIAAFGGDPNQITIAGESAGGFSVTSLLGSPKAEGLFHRAIPQSGAAHHTLTPDQGKRVAELLLEETRSERVESLLDLPAQAILEAQNRVSARYDKEGLSPGVQAFYPIAGNNLVLPVPLLQAIAEGQGAEIPVLTGTNKDEASLFMLGELTEEAARSSAKNTGGDALFDAYRYAYPDKSLQDIAVQLSTDFSFKVPAVRLAELREGTQSSTHLYQFNWESRVSTLKATHALEIPFTFNVLDAPGVSAFTGPGDLPYDLAQTMHTIWTQFIQGKTLHWPSYDQSSRKVMHFDTTSVVKDNDFADFIDLWAGVR